MGNLPMGIKQYLLNINAVIIVLNQRYSEDVPYFHHFSSSKHVLLQAHNSNKAERHHYVDKSTLDYVPWWLILAWERWGNHAGTLSQIYNIHQIDLQNPATFEITWKYFHSHLVQHEIIGTIKCNTQHWPRNAIQQYHMTIKPIIHNNTEWHQYVASAAAEQQFSILILFMQQFLLIL